MGGLVLLALGLPLVVYLSLCFLPAGWPAAAGLGAAGLVAGGAWLVHRSAAPDFDPIDPAFLALVGAGLAVPVQALRAALGPRLPRALYPALVIAAPIALLAILRHLFGA